MNGWSHAAGLRGIFRRCSASDLDEPLMMDLTQLAKLGEFIGGVGSVVGGIGVLATLIYLAVQIRHNTTATML